MPPCLCLVVTLLGSCVIVLIACVVLCRQTFAGLLLAALDSRQRETVQRLDVGMVLLSAARATNAVRLVALFGLIDTNADGLISRVRHRHITVLDSVASHCMSQYQLGFGLRAGKRKRVGKTECESKRQCK